MYFEIRRIVRHRPPEFRGSDDFYFFNFKLVQPKKFCCAEMEKKFSAINIRYDGNNFCNQHVTHLELDTNPEYGESIKLKYCPNCGKRIVFFMESEEKPKVIAIVLVYQDYDGGKRLVDNLTEFNIPSIWGDGRFRGVSGKEFPQINNSDLSTDGLKEYVLSKPNTKWLDIGLCLMESKHNILYDAAAEEGATHALLLGCDEYLEGDFELFKKNLDVFEKHSPMIIRVPMVQHKTDVDIDQYSGFLERVFYLPQFIRTRKIHWTHFSTFEDNIPDKPNVGMVSFPSPVFGLVIHHDSSLREKKRDEMMQDWQRADVGAERAPIHDPLIEEAKILSRKAFENMPPITNHR